MIADQQQLINQSENLLTEGVQEGPAATATLCWSQAEGEGLVLGLSHASARPPAAPWIRSDVGALA